MEEQRGLITLVCVGAYLGFCIAVGLWAMGRTRSSRDFFVAGRSLGIWVSAIAIFSSTLSGFGFVGGPGLTYRMGMSSVWMILAGGTGYILGFTLLARPLRVISELRDTVSLPEAAASRYKSRAVGGLLAVALLVGVMGYLATQILAMARVLQDVLGGVGAIPALDLVSCVAISTTVLVFYCVTGGVIAGVYTDLVQGLMMLVAAVLIVLACQSAVDGGFTGMSLTLLADDPEAIGPWGTLGLLGSMSMLFLFLLGNLPMAVISYNVAALLWILVGLSMRALVLQGGHPELDSADLASPAFLQTFAHPLLAGIVFAGLLAAIMSTADAFLNIGAAAIVIDLPRAVLGRALRSELLAARLATVGIGVAAAGFALYSHYANARLLALLGVFGAGTFAAALVPTVTIGFRWKRASAPAACVAIASSVLINLFIELRDVQLPHGIHGGIPALVVSLVLFLGISLASRPPQLDPDIEEALDLG
jgi:Na+/proline symporter